MVNNGAYGPLSFEYPSIISRGDYKMVTGASGFTHCPAMIYPTGGTPTQDSDDSNKIKITAYNDPAGVTPSLGIFTDPTFAMTDTGAVATRAGTGGYNRDKQILHYGTDDLVYITGTQDAYYGMKLAPSPGGCREWETGMSVIGSSLEAYCASGFRIHVKVEARRS